MPRLIRITDAARRDTSVVMERTRRPPRWRLVGPDGGDVDYATLVKTTEGRDYAGLLARFGDDDALADALVAGDPELDLELVGRRLEGEDSDRVWVKDDGAILYSVRYLRVTTDPNGDEVGREDFVTVEATVNEDAALPWTGRLYPKDEVVHRFALVRKVMLHHVDGLTFDFLRDIATTLAEADKMALVGSGARGAQPLVFQANGTPYRGFLEGRVDGDRFRLVLHLSNFELKRPA
ncbi:MAG: hypothetical protein EP329_11610 [Deltaproteobacteria bacterium]|nr:MAG: hypothetical protein EP329_11610 [Deltaproteobacteria bacterium]